jgi:hypothetical protein
MSDAANTGATIDFAAIDAQVKNMSQDELIKLVTAAKVKQKVATKKYYNPTAAKNQRLKRAAFLKEAEKALAAAGLMDQIKANVDIQVAEELADQEENETSNA